MFYRHMHVYVYTFIYTKMCVHVYVDVYRHAYISYLCPMKMPRRKYIPEAMSTPSASLWSAISFATKKNQESSEKWLIPGLGQDRY